MSRFDTIVIGAGPAGLMAAIAAAGSGRHVLICERQSDPGRKLLASGNRRCNITNAVPHQQFVRAFGAAKTSRVAAILRQFDRRDLIAFFAQHGVSLVARDGIHYYPESDRARDILDVLLGTCRNLGVTIRTGAGVGQLLVKNDAIAGVRFMDEIIHGPACVCACGGRGYPRLSGNDSGYTLARQAGHDIVEPVPGLVGLTAAESWVKECSGIGIDRAKVSIADPLPETAMHRSQGSLLFTHFGVSGPAILDLSASVARLLLSRGCVVLRFILQDETDAALWRRRFEEWQQSEGGRQLASSVGRYLPHRVVRTLLDLCGCPEQIRCADVSRTVRNRLIDLLTRGVELHITGTQGWDCAMVTAGGVALDGIDSRALSSKRVQGLFFAGEVLDSDGPCGGYNLTWALCSGWVAGTHAAARAATGDRGTGAGQEVGS